MSKTLLIDMDCILVDMLPAWLEKYNAATGENVKVSDITEYDMGTACKDRKVLKSLLNDPGFFMDMNPMPWAVPALLALINNGYDVVILTQPPRESDYAIRDKKNWIRKHFEDKFGLENMIFCHRKDMIMGDLLFDDKPEHLVKWKKSNPNGLLATLNWEYNNLPEVNKIVNFRGSLDNGWVDFVEFVNKVLPIK